MSSFSSRPESEIQIILWDFCFLLCFNKEKRRWDKEEEKRKKKLLSKRKFDGNKSTHALAHWIFYLDFSVSPWESRWYSNEVTNDHKMEKLKAVFSILGWITYKVVFYANVSSACPPQPTPHQWKWFRIRHTTDSQKVREERKKTTATRNCKVSESLRAKKIQVFHISLNSVFPFVQAIRIIHRRARTEEKPVQFTYKSRRKEKQNISRTEKPRKLT